MNKIHDEAVSRLFRAFFSSRLPRKTSAVKSGGRAVVFASNVSMLCNKPTVSKSYAQ